MNRFIGLLFCTTFLVSELASAQDQRKVDSLHRILEHRVGSCERFEALYELCFQYLQKDNTKAFHFIQQAETAALASGDSLWIAKSMRVKGILLYFFERNVEAIEMFDSALGLTKRNGFVAEQTSIQQFIGRIYLYEGQYDKALSYFLDGLQLARNVDDQELLATALHDVGTCYYKLSDYDQALRFYLKALEIHRSLALHQGSVLTNIALCYAHLGELEKAKDSNDMVAGMSDSECPSSCQMNLKYAMGLVSMLERNYAEAETYLLDSYVRAKRSHNTRFQLDNIYLLTEIFLKQKSFRKAQQYLDIAEDLMESNKSYNLEMIKIYSRFSEVYIELQNFKKASYYQSRYIALRDSIYRQELTNSLMTVQAEYLERENTAKIEAQAEIIGLTRAVFEGQRKLTLAISAVAALVVVILVFVLREYQRKRKLNILLDRKVWERTRELEAGRNELLVIVKEQDLALQHVSNGIRQKLKTIDGLCRTAEEDVSDPQARFYVSKIHGTVKEMQTGITFRNGNSHLASGVSFLGK